MKTCGNRFCPYTNPQPPSNFNRRKASPDGLQSFCRKCQQSSNRNQTELYKQLRSKRITEQRLHNPDRYNAHIRVRNAVKRGAINKLPCEICGNSNALLFLDEPWDQYYEPYDKAAIKWYCKLHHPRRSGPRRK